MTKLNIRSATKNDSSDLLEWRNDPLTIQMSQSTHGVSPADHDLWFQKALKTQSIKLLICEIESDLKKILKIGMVRFDGTADNLYKVSINLNPLHRGKGLAKKCLESSVNDFSIKNKRNIQLIAEIKASNEASKKIFCDVGFKYLKNIDNNFLQYMLDLNL
ncbi:GNAT family N-acetyltransferase [Gammaproteobacteria bacterium]|nr:GNAT family N-acetyltransferase [Woeseiaceae bacterium]MDA9049211.1 GNAT family N-acetyltransferase [Gammaproteobacteria bacterium]HCK03552.1 N-acetyltransferase [Methylophilaceae bacterium]